MSNYTLYFDGSCGPKNPGGTAAYGYALMQEGREEPLEHGSGVIGTGEGMTNNLAEFWALWKGLEAFQRHMQPGSNHLQVHGDSNLVIQIMNKHWRARMDKAYYGAYALAHGLLCDLRLAARNRITFDWVPREQNTICDELSKAHQKV